MNKINRLLKISKMFKNIKYVIIKFPFNTKHNPSDIDVLVSNPNKAIKILLKNNFVVLHSKEKYKTMLVNPNTDEMIHIHGKVAWDGIEYFDSYQILKERKKIKIQGNIIYVPSKKWEFIIHSAHSIFENKEIKKWEFKKMKKILPYVNKEKICNEFPWIKIVIKKLKNNKRKITLIEQLYYSPHKIKTIFNYIKNIFSLNHQKIICLSGPDGVGKTTQANMLNLKLKKYGENSGIFWGRTGPLTQIFYKHNILLLLPISILIDSWYIFLKIRLSNLKLVIMDRCGIDMIADYYYLKNNKKELFIDKLMPPYNKIIILDDNENKIKKRSKGKPIYIKGNLPENFSKSQREIYRYLSNKENYKRIKSYKNKKRTNIILFKTLFNFFSN